MIQERFVVQGVVKILCLCPLSSVGRFAMLCREGMMRYQQQKEMQYG